MTSTKVETGSGPVHTKPAGSAGYSPAKWKLAERLKIALEPEIDIPVCDLLSVEFGTLVEIRDTLERKTTFGNPKRNAVKVLENTT